jgi:hypothetical protein
VDQSNVVTWISQSANQNVPGKSPVRSNCKSLSSTKIEVNQSGEIGPSNVFIYDILRIPVKIHSTDYFYIYSRENVIVSLSS